MPATVTDRLDGLTTSVAVKAPVRAVTTASITLSGLQTVDGVVLVDNDRVLVKDQATASENGIYVASSTTWERARDFNGPRDVVYGTLVLGPLSIYRCVSANPIIIGSSSISFQPFGISGSGELLADDFGAVGDGVTNDTAAIQAAIDAAEALGQGATVKFSTEKTYVLRNVTVEQAIVLDFNGASIIAKPSAAAGGSNAPAIWVKGTVGTAYSLSAVLRGDRTITCSVAGEGANFAAADWVYIEDQTVVAGWNAGQSTPPATATGYTGRAEVNRVVSVSGDILTLAAAVEVAYNTSRTVRKITAMLDGPAIKNIGSLTETDPGALTDSSLYGNGPHILNFQYCLNPRVENCNVSGWQLFVARFQACYSPRLRDCHASLSFRGSTSGHGYLMRFTDCRAGIAEGNTTYRARHTIDIYNSYDCLSRGNVALYSLASAFSAHGHNSRRWVSEDDCVYNSVGSSNGGWLVGNADAGADFDTRIVRPRAWGVGVGVQIGYGSEGVIVEDPMLFTRGRGVWVHTGAQDVVVLGGTIDTSLQDGGTATPLYVAGLIDSGDAYGPNPTNFRLEGVLVKTASNLTDGSLIKALNRLTVKNCEFIGAAGITRLVNISSTAAARDLEVSGNYFNGNCVTSLQVGVVPTVGFLIVNNLANDYTTRAYKLADATARLVLRNNIGTVTFDSSPAASVAAGATIDANDGYVAEKMTAFSGTTDGSGDLAITHGLALAPVAVLITPSGTTFMEAQHHTLGASTFKIRFLDVAGAALASTAVAGTWRARI